MVIALDILSVLFEFCIGPSCNHEGKIVVRGPSGEAAIWEDMNFVDTVHRQPTPISVIRCEQLGAIFVLLGLDGSDNLGLPAIRADDDRGSLFDLRTALGMATNADNGSILDDNIIYREGFPNLDASFARGVD
jgi:hypothetical protein